MSGMTTNKFMAGILHIVMLLDTSPIKLLKKGCSSLLLHNIAITILDILHHVRLYYISCGVTSSETPPKNSPRRGQNDKNFTPPEQKKRTSDLISEPYRATVIS